MNINELKSFLMVYEYRSFSLAAKQLSVTQSAISKRIINLENFLKVKLIETRGHMVFTTTEGQLLVPYARHMLHTLNNATTNLKSPRFSDIPVFLGITHYPSLSFLPMFMKFLLKKDTDFPKLRIKHILKECMNSALQNGMVDLLLSTEDMKIESSIICNVLSEEDIFIVVSPDHPLAKEKVTTLKTLVNYPSILTPVGNSIRDKIERMFYKMELPFIAYHELSTLSAIHLLVKTGLGWSALPEQLCDDDLIKLNVSDFKEKIKLCSYCHEDRVNSSVINYLTNLIDESLL